MKRSKSCVRHRGNSRSAPVKAMARIAQTAVFIAVLLTTTISSASAQSYPGGGGEDGRGDGEPRESGVLGETLFPDESGGDLAFTGADILLMVLAGLAVLAFGLLVVRRAAHRRPADSEGRRFVGS